MGSRLIWSSLEDLQVNVTRQNRLVRSLTMVLWFLTVVLAFILGIILARSVATAAFITLSTLIAIAIVLAIIIISILIFIRGLRLRNNVC